MYVCNQLHICNIRLSSEVILASTAVRVCMWQLTVLVDEHADGDAAGVEAVQEVLDVVVGDGVLLAVGLFVLDDPLSHGGNHLVVSVPDGLQDLHKPGDLVCQRATERRRRSRKRREERKKTAMRLDKKRSEQRYNLQILRRCVILTSRGLSVHLDSCPETPGSLSDSGCT